MSPSGGARGFAEVSYDEAMRRARALVPALRERADPAEAVREMPKETIDDLHRTGLLRFHQPRRRGGSCASTGWNVANLGVHHWEEPRCPDRLGHRLSTR